VNHTVVEACTLSEVPVMVIGIVLVPVLAFLLALSVRRLVDEVGLEENEAVTPVGSPNTDKFTLPGEPLCTVTVIMLVPLLPGLTDALDGEAESEKLGAAFTVNVTVAEALV
jgi:hypothetical protein